MSYPIGEIKLINLESLPSDGSIIFRPPEGLEWIVIELYTWHNDDLGADVSWTLYNPDSGHATVTFTYPLMDPNYKIPFSILQPLDTSKSKWNANLEFALLLKFTHYFWAATVTDLAPTCKSFLSAIVIERPENLELRLVEWFAEKMKWSLPPGLEMLKSRLTQYRAGP